MKYYNIIRLIHYTFPHIEFYFMILFLMRLTLLFYAYIIITLREIQFKFSMLFHHSSFKRFDMKDREEYLNVSLFYKLYSVPLTVIEIIFYFILVILSIFILRVIRLGTTIDTYEILHKINHSLIITKVLYIFVAILYLYLLKQYIDTFASRLYYKLKILYIYLLQVGGLCDIVNYKEGHNKYSYVERYIENPIKKLNIFIHSFYEVYRPITSYDPKRDSHKKSKTLYAFYITKEYNRIAEMLVPLFYLTQLSQYKDTKGVELLKTMLKKINRNEWVVLYTFPVILLLCTTCYEYFYKQGILSNVYYILILIFVYKIYIDLMYFFTEGSNPMKNKLLCVYYYVYDKLNPRYNTDAMTSVLATYAAFTRKDREHKLNFYIENHLNLDKLCEMFYTEDYHKTRNEEINVRLKNFILGLKIVQYILLFIHAVLDYIYDKDSFIISKKALVSILPTISYIHQCLLSRKLILIMTVICLCSLWFFPQEFLLWLYIPSLIIYLSRITCQRNIYFTILLILCYSILAIIIYTFYIKYYNICYMDEILWDYGIKITRHFSVEEKVKYFKEYLHYITYMKGNNLTPVEKRMFLSCIDFKFINAMIHENTKLSALRQLAENLLSLNPSLSQSKLENSTPLKELYDTVNIKAKTFYEFVQPLWRIIKRFIP